MSLAELAKRYDATQASVKARAAYLGIDAQKTSTEDLARLDALDQHLEKGGTLGNFQYTETAEVEIVTDNRSAIVRNPTIESGEPEEHSFSNPVDLEGLTRTYEFLQKATDNGWHLPTSVVRSITGGTPRGRSWKRFGFEFKAATRHGAERAWAVSLASWDFQDD